ncbi:MAG: pyridoxamine 5'-phosphate oxidase family protein [Lachnospiraceae bacterium]|nr:pyridoxamine 5'-phosphate oxidase family protein [Lachnospiraceae bacterium]
MKLSTNEITIINGTTFPTLATMNADGTPHLIVTGKAEIVGEDLVFGIGGMVKTQENLLKNSNAWMTFTDAQPKGIRVAGTAKAVDGKLIFTPSEAAALN